VKGRVLGLALLLAAPPARAQRAEVSLLAGYATAGDIDQKAPQFQELAIASSFTWGLTAGWFFTPRLGVEASWARRESALALATRSVETDLFDVNLDQVHGSFVYQFGDADARFRPFLLAGLGAAIFSSPDLDSETKLALAAGGGLKWLPSRRLGVRLQARYNPTHLNDKSSDFCDPFGFCQGWLHQLELMGGMSVRF
jgi:opacity protein-like surface antigen